jgi:hypothetical protein
LSRIVPGLHLLMLRVSTTGGSGAGLIQWTIDTEVNGSVVGAAQAGSFDIGRPTSQTIFAVARVMIPTNDVNLAAATGVVLVGLTAHTSTTTTVDLDEAWLFNMSIGRLVGPIACGTASPSSGGAANRLFLEPPTVETPRPTIRIGYAADRSDSYFPGGTGAVQGWQMPEFTPEGVSVLTVTTNATDASVTLRGFNRWHTNAAD